jgi:hypothetical protein
MGPQDFTSTPGNSSFKEQDAVSRAILMRSETRNPHSVLKSPD